MSSPLFPYLCNQPFMKVLRGLLNSSQPRHLRDLVRDYSLSPAGVSDILRRLKALGVLKQSKIKNRKYYSLTISEMERDRLQSFFGMYEQCLIKTRAKTLEKRASEKLAWMDESYEYFKSLKNGQS